MELSLDKQDVMILNPTQFTEVECHGRKIITTIVINYTGYCWFYTNDKCYNITKNHIIIS